MNLLLKFTGLMPSTFGLLATLGLLTVHAPAAVELFEIDPSQTILSLRGSAGAGTWQEQSSGSMMSPFQGWLAIDFQAASIQLVAGSHLVGVQTNAYLPGTDISLTPSPANYGVSSASGSGFSTVKETAAVRNLKFNIAGPPISTQISPMDSSGLEFSIPLEGGASLDYRVNGLVIVAGSRVLDGLTATNSGGPVTFSTVAEVQTIDLPIDISFATQLPEAGEATLEFTGNLVAKRGLTLINPQLLWIPSLTNHQEFTLVWGYPCQLQKATRLNSPDWTVYATNAPVTVSAMGASVFFRAVP